jgi:hypothetical protein
MYIVSAYMLLLTGGATVAHFIYVENQRHDLPSDEIDVAELRRLGSIPEDNKIFRETPGIEPDPEVPLGGLFKVHEGEKFYAVPPGTFGAPDERG